MDVAGRRGQYAVPDDRGFIGLAFRVSPNAERFEYIYLRPDNGRVNDQVRRNHSTQYSAHPDFPFSRMRKEFPEKYEIRDVDLEYGAWTRMRIDVEGTTARLFVHEAPQPALVVTDLKLGDSTGGVALFIGSGTEGFFSNLRVTPRLIRLHEGSSRGFFTGVLHGPALDGSEDLCRVQREPSS